MTNKEKYLQIRREAKATGAALLILIAFWGVAGFGLSGVRASCAHLPLWVIAGVPGTWLMALVLVKLLLKFVFKDMELHEEGNTHG